MTEQIQNKVQKIQLYLRLYYTFTVIFITCLGGIVVMALSNDPDLEGDAGMIVVGSIAGFLILEILFFIIATLLLKVRKPWSYYFQLAAIGVGLTSIVTMAFSVFLLLKWADDEYRSYYTGELPKRPNNRGVGNHNNQGKLRQAVEE